MGQELILTCPFCGHDEIVICRTNKNACWVRCDNCGTDGKVFSKRKDAIKFWNKTFLRTDDAHIIDDQDKER